MCDKRRRVLLVVLSILLAGCGLTLDTVPVDEQQDALVSEPDADGATSMDAGRHDGKAPRVDAGPKPSDASLDADEGEGGGTDASADAEVGTDAGTDGGAATCGTFDTICALQCKLTRESGSWQFAGAGCTTITVGSPDPKTATIDMTGYTSLQITASIENPSGWVLHLGDSSSNSGYGGDAMDTSNDAELHLFEATTLRAYENDYGGNDFEEKKNAVSASGMSTLELAVSDEPASVSRICVDRETLWESDYFFQIAPTMDDEGSPDSLLYLGMNRTVGNPMRNGGGLQSVELCFR